MLKRILVTIVLFYILALLQVSFLPRFLPWAPLSGAWANIILLAVILINFFEKPESSFGVFMALWGGFLLDIFSGQEQTYYGAIFFISAVILKIILARYIRLPDFFAIAKRL
ncbi:MAG: hypothetical protein AAB620_01385 [Patescibacteria group bacterium]